MRPPVNSRKVALRSLRFGVLGIAVLLSGCRGGYHAYSVVGNSMRPLLPEGDRIFVDQSEQARSSLHDGDVILFHRGDEIVVKRILAMPGETIRGDQRKVFRNGKLVDEPYLAPPTNNDDQAPTSFEARTVDPDELFVMGDDRDVSFDSRFANCPPVKFSDVVGKYVGTYWHTSK